MRPDEDLGQLVSNGHSTSSNGSTPRKSANSTLNGHGPPGTTVNGSSPSFKNGSTTKRRSPVRSPTYRGHNREEVTRILIQGLLDMGYTEAANVLTRESGYELESPSVAAFRSAILEGDWQDAEAILLGSEYNDGGGGLSDEDPYYGEDGHLVLAEGADRDQMLFWIRQQKFLELLDRRDLGVALMVLRQELTPLGHDIHQLHALSTLLMCPPEDLRSKAHWPGSVEESRKLLLQDLSRSIAPSVMIRDHRLAELFDQVKQNQINQCLYHNTSVAPSLYADHMCRREDFPLRTFMQLEDHTGEVWHVQFSHDGTKLATAGQDRTVNIYETMTFKLLHQLSQHTGGVTYIAWSPDDRKLLSCSQDSRARVWDVESGRLSGTLEHRSVDQNCPITAAAWAPDSKSFVTASMDRESPLCHWNLVATTPEQPVHVWPRGFRVLDVGITADGRWLVAMEEKVIRIFDLHTYREQLPIMMPSKMTAITLSQDGRNLLVNLACGEVRMVDLATRETVRRFIGQKQGEFVIRGCFGGAAENFVLSGSEGQSISVSWHRVSHRLTLHPDGMIYVWHKENEALIERLSGHGKGQAGKECVTTVSWNPKDAGMFASGGDDRKVRM